MEHLKNFKDFDKLTEIEINNYCIAKYMGYEDTIEAYQLKWLSCDKDRLFQTSVYHIPILIKDELSEPKFIDSLNYHDDWNLLMPVCKKIADIDDVMSAGMSKTIQQYNYAINEIYKRIVQHIKLKNLQ
jgi:hypothetical protein